MNAVLISIRPKWCELIASGIKTVEVRKTKPKLQTPFKVYIYQTLHRENNGHTYSDGKVIGEFVCDSIMRIERTIGGFYLAGKSRCESNAIAQASCLDFYDMCAYFGLSDTGYAWHISNLVIYDKPKGLGEFKHCGVNYHYNPPITRPPQSWCYVEEGETDGKAD